MPTRVSIRYEVHYVRSGRAFQPDYRSVLSCWAMGAVGAVGAVGTVGAAGGGGAGTMGRGGREGCGRGDCGASVILPSDWDSCRLELFSPFGSSNSASLPPELCVRCTVARDPSSLLPTFNCNRLSII